MNTPNTTEGNQVVNWTAEERRKAIIYTETEDACCNCINRRDDGWKSNCVIWCCDVEDNETCNQFQDEADFKSKDNQ